MQMPPNAMDSPKDGDNDMKKNLWFNSDWSKKLFHYFSLLVIGLLLWGFAWSAFGDNWRWDGPWFRLSAVAVVAWACGDLLQELTTLPPAFAALIVGILARNVDILDMREFTSVDAFLRRIYPVLILGKATLGYNARYMKNNWQQISALGVVPWAAEVVTVMITSHLIVGLPWLWGLMLGALYASVTFAVVMMPVMRIGMSAGGPRMWPQIIGPSSGIDMALSVGVFGIVFSYLFVEADEAYKYTKVALSLFVGVGSGLLWGTLAGIVPHSLDAYVTEIRVLFVLLGGLFWNFLTTHLGWGGVGGVAILVCNATAANFWLRDGWMLNNNAASKTYKILWSAAEPVLLAYTGTFLVVDAAMWQTFLRGLAVLAIALVVRLSAAALVCWNMTLKERLFVCCTWTPKCIVEAVLCPMALNALLMRGEQDSQLLEYAEDVIRLTVQAIFITVPVGFLLTNYWGPHLMRKPANDPQAQS